MVSRPERFGFPSFSVSSKLEMLLVAAGCLNETESQNLFLLSEEEKPTPEKSYWQVQIFALETACQCPVTTRWGLVKAIQAAGSFDQVANSRFIEPAVLW